MTIPDPSSLFLPGRPVYGNGPQTAKIVIIGEAPGEQEEAVGQPFVGGSGQLLNELLVSVGINRHDCYVTNVCKHKPPKNDFTIFYVDPKRCNTPTEYLRQSYQFLDEELTRLKPNVIVCLGGEALRAVTSKRGISKFRGSILPSVYGKVIPSYHPAYILRVYTEKVVAKADFIRISREAKFPEIKPLGVTLYINPSFNQCIDYISACSRAERFAFDIETIGPHVRCLGLSCDNQSALCIPFIRRQGQALISSSSIDLSHLDQSTGFENYFILEEEIEILKALNALFQNPSVKKVGQNIQYDTIVLAAEFGFQYSNLYMDTMVAHHECFAELPKALDFLASIYTDIPYYSDFNKESDNEWWTYNCWDAVSTLQISYKLDAELERLHLTEWYHNHVNNLVKALLRVETRGFKLDLALRASRRVSQCVKKDESVAKVRALVGIPTFNPGSPKQMKELLYDKLRLPIKYKGRGDSRTTTCDENALRELQREHPIHKELLDTCLAYREASKLIGTYYDSKASADGWIYTAYNAAGTVTRRLSSSEFGYALQELLPSTNLQNPPRGEFREIFVAPPGYVFIKSDLSQAEFRIVVWLAGVQRIIEKYIHDPPYCKVPKEHTPFDVHKWVASLIFKKPESLVSKSERSEAKGGVYGGNYAMEAKRAAQVYGISLQTAMFILEAYRRAIPEIPQWWKVVEAQLQASRTITSPLGGKRVFFDRLGPDVYRDAYSHSAQSIVGDLVNRALYLCDESFPESECAIIGQVHDELCFYCREDLVKLYAPRIIAFMEYPLQISGVQQPLIVPAELSYGPNWFKQTKYILEGRV